MAGSPKGNKRREREGEKWRLRPWKKSGAKAQRARWRGDSNQVRAETSER